MHDFQTIFFRGTDFPAVQISSQWLQKTFWISVIMHSKYMNEYKNKEVMLETLTHMHETFIKFS